jgi:DNA-binding SARP family transcriptional activator
VSTSAPAERDDRIPHHPGHAVRINLLGPLTVTVAGEVMPLGPLKQRALLAILFCRKGVAVPSEVLIDALWTGDPPASAASNVRQYVHALRQTLGRDAIPGSGRPGYRLDLDLVSTDVAEFDRLCATAEAAAGRHDFVAARDRLAEAVALRRDRAFADVGDLPLIADEVRGVEERWLLAKQRFFDAELRLGRAAESVAELSSLTTHHPYQERFWVQLMLALYRAQRQSEALEAYRRARLILHDELGLEPGLELQAMQRRILDADPGLSGEPPTAGAPAPPAQLPPDLPVFVGRRAELDRLDAAAGRPLIVISGTAGIGKPKPRKPYIFADRYGSSLGHAAQHVRSLFRWPEPDQ